jgi:hypothetical protein
MSENAMLASLAEILDKAITRMIYAHVPRETIAAALRDAANRVEEQSDS